MNEEAHRLYILGMNFMEKKLYDNSLFYFNKALSLDPYAVDIWLEKGRALASMNKFPDAVQCFDNVIRMDPKAEKAWVSKGLAYHCMGDFELAISCFDTAIELSAGQNPETWYAKGVVLFLMHDYDVAMEHFEKTLQLFPLHKNAAIFLQDSKKRLDAGEDIDDIFDIEKETPDGKKRRPESRPAKKAGLKIVSSRKGK